MSYTLFLANLSEIYLFLFILIIVITVYQLTHRNFLVTLLIVGLLTFFSNFAKLCVIKTGVIPIYVTEGIIFATIMTLLLQGLLRGKLSYVKVPLQSEFFLLYLIFFISLLRGLFSYEDKTYVLRHSAIFYYSIFYFIVPILFNSLKKIENLFKILCCIYLVLPMLDFLGFAPYGLGAFAYFYYFIIIIFELFYILLLPNKRHKMIFLIAITGQFAVFLFAQARAAWVGAMVAMIFILHLFLQGYLPVKFIKKIIRYAFFCGVVIFLPTILLKPNLAGRLFDEVMSTFLISTDSEDVSVQVSLNNVRWRLYVWKDIINETLEKPFFGWGCGKKFIPPTIKALGWGGSWCDPEKGFQDPHNSFLSVFHRSGIIGLTIFLLIIIRFINRSLKLVRTVQDTRIKTMILASLTSIVYVLGVSFFMVVLEGPYLGISLWFLMGLIVSFEMIYKRNKDLEYVATSELTT